VRTLPLRRLFSAGEIPGRNAEVIRWWELRRIPYNLIVGAFGLASIVVFEAMGNFMLPPGEDAVEPPVLLLGVILYGVVCNAAYTLGWIGETYFFGHSREAGLVFRKRAFPVGLILSCVVPILPVGLWIILWAFGWRPR
jgi:hypothetical protein